MKVTTLNYGGTQFVRIFDGTYDGSVHVDKGETPVTCLVSHAEDMRSRAKRLLSHAERLDAAAKLLEAA